MKRFAAGLVCGGAALALLTGCAGVARDGGYLGYSAVRGAVLEDTMTQTLDEQLHGIRRVVDTDAKGIVEDWESFWQRDRPTRLTRWHEL